MLETVATVTLSFIGAQVAHKVATESIQAIWDRFAERFLARFKKMPTAATAPDAGEVMRDPEVAKGLAAVLSESAALRRVQAAPHVIRDARLLWIDDIPTNNDWECAMLRELGANVVRVTKTDSALDCLSTDSYDVILSDIARPGVADEGVRALADLKRSAPSTAVIFYVGSLKPDAGVPVGAAGITNHPEELLHLLLDALERKRI